MIEIINRTDKERRRQKLEKLLARGVSFDRELIQQVGRIIDDVRKRGDEALIDYTRQFDGVELQLEELRLSEESIERAAAGVDANVLEALRRAIRNVREFHLRQIDTSWAIEPAPGIKLEQRLRPIESVGVYVPGGTAAYPSSVMMNVVPAQVAGVSRIAVATPSRSLTSNPAVAAALRELKVDEVYSVGGAQAIAALAYGTETVRAVHKITGPGNRFVAAAKQLVFGAVGIDSIAGPSEVVIVADDSARAEYVAADLLAQAEHAEDAAAVLITPSMHLAETVLLEIGRQVRVLPRASIIRKSLEHFGAILITDTLDEAFELVNQLAPEHVQVMTSDADRDSVKITDAGAIFVGQHSPTALGDYFAGPNHVLPTGGTARFSSPLSVHDFMKRTNVIRYSPQALRDAAESVATLATVEGLQAHAQSALIRLGEAR
ncbi:MAG TPA: histidinol dehydrogenase [Pyrinomonadaceae bacterium]|nr:histidinol dehydrogenase [Pyrinomonadaceae bacterium]